MAMITTRIVIRFPAWYRAYLLSLAALAKAGFVIDVREASAHVVKNSKLTLR